MDCGELANKPGMRIAENGTEPIDRYREFVFRGAQGFLVPGYLEFPRAGQKS